MNTNKVISIVTGVLVLFLAAGAGVLSYDALRELARENGVNSGLAWIWPILIDGAVVIFSLAVLRGSLLRERTVYPWLLVGAFVALSVAFNVLHAPENTLARIIAAVPPVALFLSFELLMGQLKNEVTRQGVVMTLAQLTGKTQERQRELDQMSQQADRMSQRIETLQAQIKELQKERRVIKKAQKSANDTGDQGTNETNGRGFVPGDLGALRQANDTRQAQIEARRGQIVELLDTGQMTQAQIADELQVSIATVKRDIRSLNGRTREGS